jgi:hypothetical protein
MPMALATSVAVLPSLASLRATAILSLVNLRRG